MGTNHLIDVCPRCGDLHIYRENDWYLRRMPETSDVRMVATYICRRCHQDDVGAEERSCSSPRLSPGHWVHINLKDPGVVGPDIGINSCRGLIIPAQNPLFRYSVHAYINKVPHTFHSNNFNGEIAVVSVISELLYAKTGQMN